MYDIKPLENDWKRYKSKKRKPWYSFIIVLMILSIASYLVVSGNILMKLKNKYSKNAVTVMNHTVSTSYSFLLNQSLDEIQTYVIVKNNIFLPPPNIEKYDSKNDQVLVDLPQLNSKPKIVNTKKKKLYIKMVDAHTVSRYKDIEKRFVASKDPDDALFLAKSYYKKHAYKKAKYWALETNKIDESIEESLLIFVKSKIKLGHRNEAISILMAYLKKTNSNEAKKLLYRVKNNRF